MKFMSYYSLFTLIMRRKKSRAALRSRIDHANKSIAWTETSEYQITEEQAINKV